MSIFIKELIRNKLKNLSSGDLLNYSKQYGFSLTKSEADNILNYTKNNEIDPFDTKDRMKMVQELALITNLETAQKAQKLFTDIIKTHGLEHLFK